MQGFTTKALQDLTGGIVQSFSLNSQDRLLTYQVLNSAVPRSTLLIASINIVSHDDTSLPKSFSYYYGVLIFIGLGVLFAHWFDLHSPA